MCGCARTEKEIIEKTWSRTKPFSHDYKLLITNYPLHFLHNSFSITTAPAMDDTRISIGHRELEKGKGKKNNGIQMLEFFLCSSC